jgi:glyoxylate reductase
MLPVVFLSSEFPGLPQGLVEAHGSPFRTILLPPGGTLLERLSKVSHTEKISARAVVSLLTDRLDQATLTTLKEQLPNLALVANYAVGFNNIDVQAAGALGVAVTNTPHVLGDATADLTLLLMLMVSRDVFPRALELREQGSFPGWAPRYGLGVDLAGRTLGLVGFGDIARRVAVRAQALGMQVVALESLRDKAHATSSANASVNETCAVERVSEKEFLARTDVLSLHCPLTPQTRGWLNAERLASLKKGTIVINTSRGEVVDENALANALHSGHIFGAGLDVFCGEPVLSQVLRDAPRLLVLPHLGSATIETRTAMGARVMENLMALLQGQSPLPYQISLS